MGEKALSPKRLLHNALEAAFERMAWLPPVLSGTSAAAAAVLLALVGDLSKGEQVFRLVLGILFTVVSVSLTISIDWWRRRMDEAQTYETSQLSIAISDAIQPMADWVAAMPTQPLVKRKNTLTKVMGRACTGAILLFQEVTNIRVVIYRLNEDRDTLVVDQHHGRAKKPGSFKKGDLGRGDAAFEMLTSGEPLFEPDAPPGRSYRTFIAAPIAADGRGYGMLTIDAPNVGDLSESDMSLVVVLATLLAIAFAEAERGS